MWCPVLSRLFLDFLSLVLCHEHEHWPLFFVPFFVSSLPSSLLSALPSLLACLFPCVCVCLSFSLPTFPPSATRIPSQPTSQAACSACCFFFPFLFSPPFFPFFRLCFDSFFSFFLLPFCAFEATPSPPFFPFCFCALLACCLLFSVANVGFVPFCAQKNCDFLLQFCCLFSSPFLFLFAVFVLLRGFLFCCWLLLLSLLLFCKECSFSLFSLHRMPFFAVFVFISLAGCFAAASSPFWGILVWFL